LKIASDYLQQLADEGLKNSTIDIHRTVLKSLFKDNPFEEVKKLKENKESYQYFDYEQQVELSMEINENDPEKWKNPIHCHTPDELLPS